MTDTLHISNQTQSPIAPEAKVLPSFFKSRAIEITLVVIGLLLAAGAAVVYFQGVGAVTTLSLAIGSAAFFLGGIITLAIRICKRLATEQLPSAPLEEEKVDAPLEVEKVEVIEIPERVISPLECYQRELLKNPDNSEALLQFSQELAKSVDGLNSEPLIREKIRAFIKFFDFELIQKINDEVTKDRSVPFQLLLYLGFYRAGQKELLIKRSNSCLMQIRRHMEAGEYLGTAIDNGDCFYESLAQGLTQVLGIKVTKKELRQHVYTYVKEYRGEEWLETALRGADPDYPEAVQWTFEECIQFNQANPTKAQKRPVWGVDEIDLRLLSDIYEVRFIAIDAQWNDEGRKILPSPAREIESHSGRTYEKVVKIAYTERHCFPILKTSP